MFEFVVACNEQMVIGKENKIPWNIKEDLNHFKTLTDGHIVIMGRKTYESLPIKPLKNRYNIVITYSPEKYETRQDNVIFTTLENVSNIIRNQTQKWGEIVYVIGGSDIYKYFIKDCCKIHLTLINKDIDGDTFFPFNFDTLKSKYGFKITGCSNKTQSRSENVMFQFITYEKSM